MSHLAQQELLVPPPRERLIVGAGSASWWGVDPSSVRVAVAWIGPDDRGVEMASFPSIPGAPRLSAIYEETRRLAAELAAVAPPGVVLVEQPSGPTSRGVNHELEFAVGVIMAAVYDGVRAALGRGVKVRMVTGSWWKARALGDGRISKTRKLEGKAKRQAWPQDEYPVLVWARLNGYEGSSWDEADAIGIAEAGHREIALDQR